MTVGGIFTGGTVRCVYLSTYAVDILLRCCADVQSAMCGPSIRLKQIQTKKSIDANPVCTPVAYDDNEGRVEAIFGAVAPFGQVLSPRRGNGGQRLRCNSTNPSSIVI